MSGMDGTRILIVTEDTHLREKLQAVLEQGGYPAEAARDGEQALALLEEGRHRLVLNDWEMPAMSGLELCRAIRVCQFVGYVYTIMLASQEQSSRIMEALQAGADDFLLKPFDPQELVVRVRAGERALALEAHNGVLLSMAKLAEWRGLEIEGHLERVRLYAQVLAQTLCEANQPGYAIDAHFICTIYQTSPLHDIGNTGIRDSVLLKPGKLSPEEFNMVKFHTLIGAATMDVALRQYPDDEFLRMAKDIALAHHEWFDGTGYPHGLAGRRIPLAARIVALAHAYDTLTTPSRSRASFSHEQALAAIQRESGTHFDPEIVAVFATCAGVLQRLREISTGSRSRTGQIQPA
jgi:putative two-component system response regulator